MGWLDVFLQQQSRNKPGNRMQVATVDAQGAPQQRTVVLRGFTRGGEPWFFTDGRSEKVRDLAANPRTGLLVWWERTSDQFRLEGVAALHGPEAAGEAAVLRGNAWQRLPEVQQKLFLGSPPGALLSAANQRPASASPKPPPEFVVVTVAVHRVDWLRLGATHTRLRFTLREALWVREELVP